MEIGLNDISNVLTLYDINFGICSYKYFINSFDERKSEAKFIIKVDLNNKKSLIVKFIHQGRNSHDIIEEQSRFSEHLRMCGVLTPKRYKNDDVYCITYPLNGLTLDVTVEDYIGEEIKVTDNDLAFKIGQLMGQNHCIAEKDNLHINACTIFNVVGYNEVSGYDEFLKFGNDGLINKAVFNDICYVYEKKLNLIKSVWDSLPKYATQGDYSTNNLAYVGDELGIVSDSGMECNSWMARPWQYEEELHPTNWVVSRSIDFLRKRDRTKPFFLFQSFVRPHSPFDAPPCYFDMYNQMELTPPPIGDWADDTHKTVGRIHNNNYMSPDLELVRQAQVGYYACITHLDHQIGRFMQALAEDNVLQNTFIIFVADHGELMGDHHLFRKSVPYEGSARIPLVVRPHSGFYVKRGTTRNNVAELRDIMPTLLDIAGAEISETVDGISLCDVLQAEETTQTREYLHGEHTYDHRSNHYIVTERDKYIWFSQSGREQYFDLVNDPQELEDKINSVDCSERINTLRKWLVAELEGRPEGYSDGENLIVGRKYTPVLF